MASLILIIITGSAFAESVIPIDSCTVITTLGVRIVVEGVVGAAVSARRVVGSVVACGVGVGVKVREGAAVSGRPGVGAGSGWAQEMATTNNRANPRQRRVIIDVPGYRKSV